MIDRTVMIRVIFLSVLLFPSRGEDVEVSRWSFTPTDKITSRCSACMALSHELKLGILSMRPRDHPQPLSTLFDYKISELQAMNLLDGLCPEVLKWYTVGTFRLSEAGKICDVWYKHGGKNATVVKPPLKPPTRFPGQAEDIMKRRLHVFCQGVLDEFEVRLEKDMSGRQGVVWKDVGEIDEYLCSKETGLVPSCPDEQLPLVWINEPVPPPSQNYENKEL